MERIMRLAVYRGVNRDTTEMVLIRYTHSDEDEWKFEVLTPEGEWVEHADSLPIAPFVTITALEHAKAFGTGTMAKDYVKTWRIEEGEVEG